MSEQEIAIRCKYCQAEMRGPFCAQCGAPQNLKRIDARYIMMEIAAVLNFDKGYFFTVKELLLRPGIAVRNFIHHDRGRLVKPIIFTLLSSFIYVMMQQIFGFEDGNGYAASTVDENGKEFGPATTAILNWVRVNYGFANIIMAFFIALWVKIFFRKYEYNIFEIVILVCYVTGLGMFIYLVLGLVEFFIGIELWGVSGLLAWVYASWGMARFFDGRKKKNYLKAFLAYLVGTLMAIFIVLVFGIAIDVMWRLQHLS